MSGLFASSRLTHPVTAVQTQFSLIISELSLMIGGLSWDQ